MLPLYPRLLISRLITRVEVTEETRSGGLCRFVKPVTCVGFRGKCILEGKHGLSCTVDEKSIRTRRECQQGGSQTPCRGRDISVSE